MAEIDIGQRWQENTLATAMLMRDTDPNVLDGLYIHGLSEGMIGASKLFGQAVVDYSDIYDVPVAFNGSDGEQFSHNEDGDNNKPVGKNPGEGWPGKNWYIEQLAEAGIARDLLLPTGSGYHTRHEVTQLVRFSREHEWKRVGILTVAWHYSRVFTNLVSVMQGMNHYIAAYAMAPEQTDWYYPMKGSQGLEDTYPLKEAVPYFGRTLVDQDRGLACSFPDLFRYLKDREQIASQNSW